MHSTPTNMKQISGKMVANKIGQLNKTLEPMKTGEAAEETCM